MKYAYKSDDIPKVNHFAIITFGSKWNRDYDDSSRGFSSPAVEYYEWTLDKDEWEKECLFRASQKGGNKDFVPIEVKPRQIKQTFTLG